eukprot:Phypoly_transcript_18141.p1 GENE.Phypoly_transcript_18141~~Phypoly_transcript_18141.p1  ORF type:complete len:223 (+),score=24.23 Phypoly_transcript_18141:97-765(+)
MMQQMHIIFVLLFAVYVSLSHGQANITKPTWPPEFSIPFGLHFTAFVYNSSATMYYNYDKAQSQLIVYDTHCFPFIRFNSVEHPCKMYFNPAGIYVSMPTINIPCCLFVPDVGAVPPTFLQGFTYSGYNDTVLDMYGKEHVTYRWDGTEDFKYWTDVDTGDDVQFQDGPTGVKWNFGEMQVGAQDPALFDLPAGDCNSSCGVLNSELFSPQKAYIPFFNWRK